MAKPIYERMPSAFMQPAPTTTLGRAGDFAYSTGRGFVDGLDNAFNFMSGAVQAPAALTLGAPARVAGRGLNAVGLDSAGRFLGTSGKYLTDHAAASANRALAGVSNTDGTAIESLTGGVLPEFNADFARRNNYGTAVEQANRETLQGVADLASQFVSPTAAGGAANATRTVAPTLLGRLTSRVAPRTTAALSKARPANVINAAKNTRAGQAATRAQQAVASTRPAQAVQRVARRFGVGQQVAPGIQAANRLSNSVYTGTALGGVVDDARVGQRDYRQLSDYIAANPSAPEAPADLANYQYDFTSMPLTRRSVGESTSADPVEAIAPVAGANVMMPSFRAQRPDTAPNPNLYAQNEYASRLNLREPRVRKGSKPAAQGTPPAPSPDSFFQKELRQYADRYGYGVNPERYKLEPAQAPPEVRTERPDVATPPQSNPTLQPATTPSTAAASNMNRRQSDLMQRMNATAGGNNSLYTAGPAPQSMAAPSSVDLAAKMPSSRTQQDRMLTNPSRPSRRAQVNLTNSYNQAQARKQQANQNFLSAGNAQVNGNTSTGTTSLGGSYTRTVDPVTGKRKVVGAPMIGDRARRAGITPANANTPAGRRRVNVLASNSRARRNANPAFKAYQQRLNDRRNTRLARRSRIS